MAHFVLIVVVVVVVVVNKWMIKISNGKMSPHNDVHRSITTKFIIFSSLWDFLLNIWRESCVKEENCLEYYIIKFFPQYIFLFSVHTHFRLAFSLFCISWKQQKKIAPPISLNTFFNLRIRKFSTSFCFCFPQEIVIIKKTPFSFVREFWRVRKRMNKKSMKRTSSAIFVNNLSFYVLS